MFEIKNIQKQYHDVKIGPLNFGLETNQLVSIIGHSGAGKTTLIKMIAQVQKPDQGEINFENQRIKKNDIAYITQKPMLFNHLTILENFGLLDLDLAGLETILTELNLSPQIVNKYPFEISGGQAQRINFARVLLQKTKIILLDEAFSALDINSKDEIYDLIYNLMKKHQLLIILVTHDIQEAFMLSDQIILMDNGTIIDIATPDKLLENDNENLNRLISPKRKKILQGLLHE